jgi:glycine/D-amino acid oxidase-like deaminating enzyme
VAGGRRDTTLEAENTAVEEATDVIQAQIEELVRELSAVCRVSPIGGRGSSGRPPTGYRLWDRFPAADGVWLAAGYSGHGNIMGVACGELVAQAILGRPAPEFELFDPARLIPS